MTTAPSPPAWPRLALVGFVLLLALAVAIGLLLAGRKGGAGDGTPPPVVAELPDFELVNRDGRRVSRAGLRGRPWVVDLIFTSCTLSCPRMTMRMSQLGDGLARSGARRVSITVDPRRDTPEVLAEYAAAYGVQDPEWLFLTGERAAITRLVREGFLLALEDAPPPGTAEEILHSSRFVLVDSESRVRGYYDAFQAGELERLLADLSALGPAGG